jgi:hypothetical protein
MRIRGIPIQSIPELLLPRPGLADRDVHLFLSVCDHYEPMWHRPPRHVQDARVARWVEELPVALDGLEDSTGRPPQHTFFYPGDEYDPAHVDEIAGLCRAGFGDVEVHLHHRHDTSESLREKLANYAETLHRRHGLLERDASGQITYGFIHGNWALDNSHPHGDWCGVNDELTILRETGCYADFTMPAAPSPCQTTTVNSIYYAIDDPQRPRSHDRGIAARVGQAGPKNGLLMIQGPLTFDWRQRKWSLVPRLENGDLTGRRPATIDRLRLWAGAAVSVAGRPDWRFIKLHTHGAQEANAEMFLGGAMRRFHVDLRAFAATNSRLKYHYVTAREMAGLIHQAERGAREPVLAAPAETVAATGRAADALCRL